MLNLNAANALGFCLFFTRAVLTTTAAFSPHRYCVCNLISNKNTITSETPLWMALSNAQDNGLISSHPKITSSRSDFLVRSLFITAAATATTLQGGQPAFARGRATLEQSYDRYSPRILAGGKFYSSELKELIGKNDWAGIKAATSDPPKKQKSDRVKIDGGIAERAAKAGGFSDARVLVACDLYGGSFSDSSITAKTNAMKEKVDSLRKVVEEMNLIARQALGEERPEGGLFGIGAKVPSQVELQKNIRQLYTKGGNYWNEYVFAANEGLPVKLAKLPYL